MAKPVSLNRFLERFQTLLQEEFPDEGFQTRLRKAVRSTAIECAYLDRLRVLFEECGEDGWLDGHGKALFRDKMKWAEEVLRQFAEDSQLPYLPLFLNPDGHVQLEWVLGDLSCDLLLDLQKGAGTVSVADLSSPEDPPDQTFRSIFEIHHAVRKTFGLSRDGRKGIYDPHTFKVDLTGQECRWSYHQWERLERRERGVLRKCVICGVEEVFLDAPISERGLNDV